MSINKYDSLWDSVLNAHADYLESAKDEIALSGLTPIESLRYYGTVHIGFGNRKDMSIYIDKTADDNDLILARYTYGIDLIKSRVNILGLVPAYLLGTNSPITEGRIYNSVWIEGTAFLDPSLLNGLYEKLVGRCKRFILVK